MVDFLDYFFQGYYPFETKNGVRSFIELELLEDYQNKEGLERIITFIEQENVSQQLLRPAIGEYLAQEILDSNIKRKTEKEGITARLISGKNSYVINKSTNYIAKLNGSRNIVILRKNKNMDEEKFGFTASEIDGLYLIKKQETNDANKKRYYVIESKTGVLNIDIPHIVQDIIFPLREMYETRVDYCLFGMPSKIYRNQTRNNKYFSQRIIDIWKELERHDIGFYPFAFPFDENYLESLSDKVSKRLEGWERIKYGKINKKKGKGFVILPNGEKLEFKL